MSSSVNSSLIVLNVYNWQEKSFLISCDYSVEDSDIIQLLTKLIINRRNHHLIFLTDDDFYYFFVK